MTSLDDDMDSREPVAAWCDEVSLHVKLIDGREIATPIWWYPSLVEATHAQRNNIELMYSGIHWPDLDEDLSVEGMLGGRKHPKAKPPAQAAE